MQTFSPAHARRLKRQRSLKAKRILRHIGFYMIAYGVFQLLALAVVAAN